MTPAAIRAGDEAAFALLVERHHRALRAHCYRMLGSFADAEDTLQETWLRAWRGRHTFRGERGVRPWLYRIATRACLDALTGPGPRRSPVPAVNGTGAPAHSPRAEVTWLEPYPDELLDPPAPEEERPEALALARETIELTFIAALQHLPPRQRAVLILRDVADRSAAETADIMGTSVTSVKSALRRAREGLRDHLPARRSEWRAGPPADRWEREVLRRYLDASRRADLSTLAALLAEDIRQCMPPDHLVFEGREAVLDLWRPVLTGDGAWGEWWCEAIAVNRQPAAINRVRRGTESAWTPVNIDVLRVEGGLITEIVTFTPSVLGTFRRAARAASPEWHVM
ncbi:RNA polymerase subunit sigma-70 [Streptomyces calidiresistens]|uniref:Sigma-70 family RNA polymerase sigma factor n=1 Tax=Streptomyces calidiresistens TaxID=1485586 RepID=A0A7W3T2T8_9ACTN|nr:RNA polymerase subunit sigma-70 [Streptomyces calidiresistens]MBB0229753.1 sigma-70 family RNA polymerase sigma factor [Streptomyces calidiresistens]